MLNDVGIVCFLGSYAIALCLEFARFRAAQNRSTPRTTPRTATATVTAIRIATFVVATLGAVAQGAFLYRNDLLQNDRFFANASGWFFVLAFCVVLSYLYLSLVYPRAQFGPFLLPVVFVLCGVGIGAGDAAFAPESTCRWVRTIHGISLLLATALTFVGSVAGAMFFLQRSRLKRKIFVFGSTLPSLEWLGRATRFSANVGLLFFGIGVASGYYLKIFAVRPGASVLFGDPVALGATILFLAVVCRRIVRWKSGVDDAADAAFLSIVCAVAFSVLLLFIAFSKRGHWSAFTVSRPDVETSVPQPSEEPRR